MRFLLSFFLMFISTSPVLAQDTAQEGECYQLNDSVNLSFKLSESDDFFNCLRIEKFGPTDNLKVVTFSSGMSHTLNIYNDAGSKTDVLNVNSTEYTVRNFSDLSDNNSKLVELIPTSQGLVETQVNVSYVMEIDGKHILIISSVMTEEETSSTPPPPPPEFGCIIGELCWDPLSGGGKEMYSMNSSTSQCTSSNTPPTSEEMGLDKEGINEYISMMYDMGTQSSGLIESLSTIYHHYSQPAQNPKALPGGTEHGGNFRYGAGVAAYLDGAGNSDLLSDYLSFGGSAFQGAYQDYTEVAEGMWFYDQLRWVYTHQVVTAAAGHGLLLIENNADQESIRQAIKYYREVYKNDPNKSQVKDSCTQESIESGNDTNPTGGTTSVGGYYRISVIGGSIPFSYGRGTICDPGDDCYHDRDPE